MMPQVAPVDFELSVIVHMDKLMHQRFFHVFLAEEMVLAQYDGSCLGAEASRLSGLTWRADDVLGCNIVSGKLHMLEHKDNRRTCSAL